MFDAIRQGFKKARDLFAPLFQARGEDTPTQNEMRLDADEWAVKRKLGRSFFTRRLNPNTRAARIASLSNAEYDLARNRGWFSREAKESTETFQRSISKPCRRGRPEASHHPGWTTPPSALRPSFTRAEPPGCPRAWSARTQAT